MSKIAVQDNTVEISEPSGEALELETPLIDFLTMESSSIDVAMEALLVTFTSLLVHTPGDMEIKKKQAHKALDAMFAFAEREHASCIFAIDSDNNTQVH